MEDYIILIIACIIALICGLLIGIVISNLTNSFKMPKNMKISTTKYPNINLRDPELKETVYRYSDDKIYEGNEDIARSIYGQIVLNCRKCNIFFGDTRVTKLNDIVKKNDLIAVTTGLTGNIYATSYERIATLYENPEKTYFEMCIAAAAENIIDGYYSVIVQRDRKAHV